MFQPGGFILFPSFFFRVRKFACGGAECYIYLPKTLSWLQQEEGERDAWLAEMDEGTMEEAIGAASTR